MIVVSDTSPILNLVLIGRLDLLRELYSQVLIPTAVYLELSVPEGGAPPLIDALSRPWLIVASPVDHDRVRKLRADLDHGEAEAIALAVERHADLLLIDERHGRRIAMAYGLPITGLIGVLVEAKARRLVDAVKPLLDDLVGNAGFWVSPNLYAEVLRNLGEA